MLNNLIVILFLFTSSLCALPWSRAQGLNPGRAPYAAVEANIYDAMTCRDNYRIASNITTDQLAYVIEATKECAQAAMFARRFVVLTNNLTAYQLRLFTEYGYTVAKLPNNEGGQPQYNVTWRLLV